MTESRRIDANLRACFRALSLARPLAESRVYRDSEIVSLGVRFQMFNAAFSAQDGADRTALERAVLEAKLHFSERRSRWSFWLCDGGLADAAVKAAARLMGRAGLTQASSMPGMILERLAPPTRVLPECRLCEVVGRSPALDDFRAIGSDCFRVPREWFGEVFDERMGERRPFRGWVAYANGRAVATAATVASGGVLGLYNVATTARERGKGYAEQIMRMAIEQETDGAGEMPIVLQSTALGLELYQRLGFRAVTNFRVFNT